MTHVIHTAEEITGIGVNLKKIIGYAQRIYFDYLMLRKALVGRRFERSLEIGCGIGRISPFVAEYSDKHYGIDPEGGFIQLARKYVKGVRFECATIQNFNPSRFSVRKGFDLAVFIMTLSHFTPKAAREAADKVGQITSGGAWVYLHETTKTDLRDHIPRFAHDYPALFKGFKLVRTFPTDRHRRVWVLEKEWP